MWRIHKNWSNLILLLSLKSLLISVPNDVTQLKTVKERPRIFYASAPSKLGTSTYLYTFKHIICIWIITYVYVWIGI